MRLLRITLIAFFAFISTGCDDDANGGDAGDSGTDAPSDGGGDTSDGDDVVSFNCADRAETGDWPRHTLGDWEVAVEAGSGNWAVFVDGVERLSARMPCDTETNTIPAPLRIGDGEPQVQAFFGAWRINVATSAMGWHFPDAEPAPVINDSDGELFITWGIGTDASSLRFSTVDGGNLSIEPSAADGHSGELSMNCRDGEAFFGLGAQTSAMNLRGHAYPLWTQEQGIGKSTAPLFPIENVIGASYAPMGVWHSSAGYSAIIAHDNFSELELCVRDDNLTLRSYLEMPSFVLVRGDALADRIREITEYTGRVTSPPDWVFSPWASSVGGPERLRAVVEALETNNIPTSAIWTEDWIGGELTQNGFRLSYAWEWDTETYPDLPDDIEALHDSGYAFLGYFNPFVPDTNRMWSEGVEGGFLMKDADGEVIVMQDPAFRDAGWIDLSNDDAQVWIGDYIDDAATALGIDGWMADFAEWTPYESAPASGETGWEYHNRFPLDWQRLHRDRLERAHTGDDEGNWTFFVRSGWASVNGGTGGIAPIMWGGDQNTDWGEDDGIPSVIPIATHLGLSGVAMFGSDISGYSSISNPASTKELFFRWTSLGAFHPVMRTHHGSEKCENWSFDRDAETIAHFARYARIHTLLLPYFRQLADEAVETGMPLTRHPALVEEGSPELYAAGSYTFFVGDDIYVAPIVTEGQTTGAVRLPSLAWWPLLASRATYLPGEDVDYYGTNDGSADDSAPGSNVNFDTAAPPTEIPVFVRSGRIIPLLGEAVESFYGSSADRTHISDIADYYRLAMYVDFDGNASSGPFDDIEVTVTGGDPAAGFASSTLPVCAESSGGAAPVSCIDQSLRRARLVVDSTQTVSIGEADVAVTTPRPVVLDLYYGGEAFGDLRQATPLTDLSPDVPSTCVVHED